MSGTMHKAVDLSRVQTLQPSSYQAMVAPRYGFDCFQYFRRFERRQILLWRRRFDQEERNMMVEMLPSAGGRE